MDPRPEAGVVSIPAKSKTIEVARLPPSKSHLIRWLLLASQGDAQVEIRGVSGAAKDACAMRDALIQLGVQIDIEDDIWRVHGVGPNGFNTPSCALNMQNSGTGLRFIGVAIARIGEWVSIDGDSTLEARINRSFWGSLGLDVEFDSERNLPMKIKGPMNRDLLPLDCQQSSQYLSAVLLSMPSREKDLELAIEGSIVSRRHAQLSFDLASKCGSPNSLEKHVLKPWKCKPPTQVEIPPDASHVAFWKLYEIIHDSTLLLPDVQPEDSIGAEILQNLDLNHFQTVDLNNANDLITPLAAAMAIGGGGVIVGARHAQYKESNRIECTVELLSKFSIDVERTEDGLKISGGQRLSAPEYIVPTFGDHRMQMTAVILATKVGAEIEGADLHEVSFPQFIDVIQP